MPGTDCREIWLFKLTCCVDHCYISQDDQQTNIKIERRTPGVIQGSLWWMFTFMTPSQWHTCFSQNQQVVLFPLVVTWWTDLVSFPFGLKPKYLEKNYNHPLLFDQKLYVWQKKESKNFIICTLKHGGGSVITWDFLLRLLIYCNKTAFWKKLDCKATFLDRISGDEANSFTAFQGVPHLHFKPLG